ncbi:hypothetical protein MESMUL_22840 [Mesosutterella multiformis]|uniref:Uncharacterized protein n=1 Tax=Mesosutterella multiformis TaxID=2259133 RepID=A0A388SHL8_9BURK|nr:hypothetical protein [Mesosutterella multiformis]GBO94930.1 hypothetical protein MESMUL_22840 [Mesosutterella multiformis]
MAGLLENPFVILGVTPTSPRREILEKAEEASLSVDPDLCLNAVRCLRIQQSGWRQTAVSPGVTGR